MITKEQADGLLTQGLFISEVLALFHFDHVDWFANHIAQDENPDIKWSQWFRKEYYKIPLSIV